MNRSVSQEDFRVDGVILMKLGHSVLTEEAHVLSNREGKVIAVDLLLVDNLVSKSLTEPSDVSRR